MTSELPATRSRAATLLMPGKCGELVQGTLGGVSFLVACPIDRYSAVSVTLFEGQPGLVLAPADSPKAGAAVRAALRHFGRTELGARLSLDSPLPRGKGMGSSTADVAGAIYAVALALGETIDPLAVARLALMIEPTDGSLFPNLALFDHREGRQYEDLGPPPPLDVAVLDFGGEVDTVAFNHQDWSAVLRENEPMVSEALALVRRGIREGRPDLIGRGASLSAVAHQKILFKPALPDVLALTSDLGAVGVTVGHSGTVIGVLVDARRGGASEVVAEARRCLPGLEAAWAQRVVCGGLRVYPPAR